MTTILEQAAAIVDADREKTYGKPDKNLRAIAEFWEAWLRARGKLAPDAFLTFEDVACMMAALKLARLANDPKHVDSAVDACGYLYLLDKINRQQTEP